MPTEHPNEISPQEVEQLHARIAELENELADSQEVIAAIRSGEVDAVVVSGPDGEQVFTLRGAEAAYRELVEAMNEGAATISADRTLLYCNQQLASLLDIPLDQIMGRRLDEFLDADAMSVTQALIARALVGIPGKAELNLRSLDGHLVPIQLSVSKMKIEEPTALCLVASDLTESKRWEALVAAGKLTQSILESSAEGIVVCDRHGYIQSINSLLKTMSGRNPLLEHFDEAFPLLMEKKAGPEFPFRIAMALHDSVQSQEVRYRASDGSDRYLLLSSGQISNEEGAAGCVLTLTDITARKKGEQSRLASEQRLRTAAEIANLGSWDLDLLSGRMICSDQCKKNYGWPLDRDFNYADLRAAIHPEDELFVAEVVAQAIASRELYRAEYRNVWPDGSIHWVVAAGRAQYDDAGTPVSMAGFTLDVTDRHKAQEALLQSEKLAAVGRLASSIAHEINNPLESVTNLLYIAHGSDDLGAIKEHLTLADLELRRVAAITNQTLRFHRQSGRTKEVTSGELFDSVLSIFQRRLENSSVQVRVQTRSTGTIRCLDGEIRQVLTNLVSNAIDAMQPGGCMLVRSRDGHRGPIRGIWLTIADNGSGMSTEVRDKVFDAFYSTKGINGTGLGLWISQEIVQRHGGRLIFRTDTSSTKHGCVFSLFLPCESPLDAAR
ncbi:PAS domain-containing sensor histidine kinase [Terriglobus sp. TAA 43]|uniref:PAS domain-containing sensor histidine kinase n=1 Tax=Terriglobus sp. TAA 43 TaxID=278961 RepID=UPI00068B1F32|nr:PAS domain-containing sensor histidine kinase [Terriglobus sp. TAA 43]